MSKCWNCETDKETYQNWYDNLDETQDCEIVCAECGAYMRTLNNTNESAMAKLRELRK